MAGVWGMTDERKRHMSGGGGGTFLISRAPAVNQILANCCLEGENGLLEDPHPSCSALSDILWRGQIHDSEIQNLVATLQVGDISLLPIY